MLRWEARIEKISCIGHCSESILGNKRIRCEETLSPLKGFCSGVGERDVRAVLGKSRLHQRLSIRFQNKAALKQVRARTVQIRHQLDLVSMESMPVKWNGKVFKYVLSLNDIFSRYHWLIPLERKKSSPIAVALSTIY